MEVFYLFTFQLLIIVSVVGSAFFGFRYLIPIGISWFIFTLLFVTLMSPLMYLQMCVLACAFIVAVVVCLLSKFLSVGGFFEALWALIKKGILLACFLFVISLILYIFRRILDFGRIAVILSYSEVGLQLILSIISMVVLFKSAFLLEKIQKILIDNIEHFSEKQKKIIKKFPDLLIFIVIPCATPIIFGMIVTAIDVFGFIDSDFLKECSDSGHLTLIVISIVISFTLFTLSKIFSFFIDKYIEKI